ncbi:MAG: TonB-dependent receptor [Vicinamibacterales bacterium]
MTRSLTLMMAAVALIVAASRPAQAQVDAGSILVRAIDEQGSVVPGVTVTIKSPVIVAGQVVAVTDSRGTYRFTPLSPGVYSVTFELPGFQTVIRENTTVNVGQTTPVELVMRVATLQETVTVTGESAVVDTSSANVATTLSEDVMQRTPGGRDIWSLVESKVPGLVTSRPDVGGAAAGLQASASARGTPSSENSHFVNGLNVGSPTSGGASPFYYDFEALQEVQISVGSHDLSVRSSGVVLNMVTKSGTDQYRGRASLNWQGDASQTTNVTDELANFGFREDAGATEMLLDGNVQLGGPIIRNKLRFFASLRDWRANVNVPGFPEIEKTSIRTADGSVGWQVTPKNTFTGYVNQQWYAKPNRGASPLETPDTTADETFYLGLYQAVWNSVFTNRAFMDLRGSFNDMNSYFAQKGTEQSLLDASTGMRTRARAVDQTTIMPKLHVNANLHYYLDEALGGRHELRMGVDYERSGPVQRNQVRIDDLDLTYRSQPVPTASTVRLWNSPVNSRQRVDVTAFYLQDRYSVGDLTLVGGARFERAEGFLPRQESPPSRWFPNAQRSFEEVRNIPLWWGVAPRVSAIYAFSDRTALKASAGRYLYSLYTGSSNSVNRNFQASESYAWNDLNGDLIFQPGELGALLSRSGGSFTDMDPDLRQPHTDELSAGVDHELIPGLRLSANFTYRQERDLYAEQDVGVPASAYRLVSLADLGRDGRPGTGDEGTIGLWDQNPATLGQSAFVIANSEALNRNYRGLEITATKRFSDRWQMVGGYTLSRAVANALAVTSPNSLVNSRGVTDFDRPHIFKLTGSYLLPGDVTVSGNFRTQSGAAQARTATYRLSQGNVTVNVEPRGAARLDPMTTVEARLSKSFSLGGERSLELLVDAYNLANASTAWTVRTLTGRVNVRQGGEPTGALINQQQFLSPTAILAPRVVRFGFLYRF